MILFIDCFTVFIIQYLYPKILPIHHLMQWFSSGDHFWVTIRDRLDRRVSAPQTGLEKIKTTIGGKGVYWGQVMEGMGFTRDIYRKGGGVLGTCNESEWRYWRHLLEGRGCIGDIYHMGGCVLGTCNEREGRYWIHWIHLLQGRGCIGDK